MNNRRKALTFLVSIVMMGIAVYQLLQIKGLEESNSYNAGRVAGSIILMLLGFMVYRRASKKNRGLK